MVFQLCTKCFYLKGPMHGRFRGAGSIPLLMRFRRNFRVLHDTWNLVTSAGEPGKHNFLCLIQVSSAAAGPWEWPSLGPLLGFSSSGAGRAQIPAAKRVGYVCGNLEGDLYVLRPAAAHLSLALLPVFSGHSKSSLISKTRFSFPLYSSSARRARRLLRGSVCSQCQTPQSS